MFICALYELAESCDFGAQKTENIRDKLVVGIKYKELSRTVNDTAVLTVRQAEDTIQQVSQQEEGASRGVQEVTRSRHRNHQQRDFQLTWK
ncbi:hypothetical protein QQF64_007889 [Cirrhinus molitorella]|uniref:Uncharacterized protein n=1 Tax=Cirrhinus molitorella TaxID=172907 RepID=A0ABR3M4L1_9TELE